MRAVDADGVLLEGGERIAARTTICATGMRASSLAAALGVDNVVEGVVLATD